MAPIKFFGKKAAFPRPGAWTTVGGKLGVIFDIKDGNADVHLVKPDGTTDASVVVPATSLTIASHDDLAKTQRNAHLSPFDSAAMGYTLSDAQVKGLTALQRKQLGLSLNDADLAQGLIEESEANLAALKRDRIAKHPEAIALETQIEKERQAFVTSVEARRTALAAKLTKEG